MVKSLTELEFIVWGVRPSSGNDNEYIALRQGFDALLPNPQINVFESFVCH
jgi:hypothetical protein